MAHFFDSVAHVLRKPVNSKGSQKDGDNGGRVRVSLVQGQEVRWDLVRQAQRSHLALESINWFDESLWPGYVVKRNKHGGSFKNEHTRRHVRSDMQSCYFTFGFGEVGIDPEVFPDLHKTVLQSMGAAVIEADGSDPDRPVVVINKPTADASRRVATINTNNNSNNNAATSSISDAIKALDINDALPESDTDSIAPSIKSVSTLSNAKPSRKQLRQQQIPQDLVCPHCKKQLASARAYSQHVRMVHELLLFGSDWQPSRPKSIPCSHCNKSFVTAEDLWQHEINKHTSINPSDLPNTISTVHPTPHTTSDSSSSDHPQELLEKDYDYVPCDVCGQAVVRRDWGMLLHLESLKPALGLDMCCPLCPKTFIEQRALYQHYKFCRLNNKVTE
eukprot:jgi/Hompol1/3330/HPOL_006474-RA